MTYAITARAAFGKKCTDQESFISVILEYSNLSSGFLIADFFPSLKAFHRVSSQIHKLKKNHQEADRILGNIVNEHKEIRARAKGTSEESDEDLVDVLLRLQEHGEFPLTDSNIKAIILILCLDFLTFSGGSETSSTVVEWAMLKMTMASSADSEGPWFLPDILVNVRKSGDETLGVIQEVISDGSCKVALGSNRSGNTVITLPSEMEIIPPRKSDKIKIMGCSLRGFTGKLIGEDATDDI
ncbi:hypothetical protein PTKIN_Ptkin02bG0112600 [Pterospermum kingtungense]